MNMYLNQSTLTFDNATPTEKHFENTVSVIDIECFLKDNKFP